MGISEKDREFMEQVAAFFRSTKDPEHPKGSIRETSIQFNINRNKVRKILITYGELFSPITEEALELRKKGLSIEETAEKMGISTATVSTYLPYDDRIRYSLDPADHARAVREYRAYEREQAKRQVARNAEEQCRTGGMKMSAAKDSKADIGKDRIFWGGEVKRLHLELVHYLAPDGHDIETLKTLGKIKFGNTISRDVVVPADMPLYAIHYMIQRLFGWQNSHLHTFELEDEEVKRLTENKAGVWLDLMGVIFRSSMMDLNEEFWADDYKSGSIKNWLAGKYTGPYLSLCRGEGYLACQKEMKKYYSMGDWYVHTTRFPEDGEEYVRAIPVQGIRGKNDPPDISRSEGENTLEIMPFSEVPVEAMKGTGERGTFDLLERLPIGCILSPKPVKITGRDILAQLDEELANMERKGDDSPKAQINPETAFTDTIYYGYDSGDGWTVKITMKEDCRDLIYQGRITRYGVEKAIAKCREAYRPVTLAADGEMLMDDVGGPGGFVGFLEKINPDLRGMLPGQVEQAEAQKEEMLSWAQWVGWKKYSPMI